MYSGTGGAQMFVAASTPATQLGTCAVGPPRRTKDSAAALKVQYFSLRRKLEQWDTRTTARGGGCCGLRVEKARRTSGERGSPIGTRETESIAASSLTRGTGSLCGEGWRGHSCGPPRGESVRREMLARSESSDTDAPRGAGFIRPWPSQGEN